MQGQADSLSGILTQIPLLNFIFLAANTYFMLHIKLAISKLETEIELKRAQDKNAMQTWVKDELKAHTQNCNSYKIHNEGD